MMRFICAGDKSPAYTQTIGDNARCGEVSPAYPKTNHSLSG
jgi:hypothetical protein